MRTSMRVREWVLLAALAAVVTALSYTRGQYEGVRQHQEVLAADNAALSYLADVFEELYLETLLDQVPSTVPTFRPFPMERKVEPKTEPKIEHRAEDRAEHGNPLPLLPNLERGGAADIFRDGGFLPRPEDIVPDPKVFRAPRKDPVESVPLAPLPFPYEFYRIWWNHIDRQFMDC